MDDRRTARYPSESRYPPNAYHGISQTSDRPWTSHSGRSTHSKERNNRRRSSSQRRPSSAMSSTMSSEREPPRTPISRSFDKMFKKGYEILKKSPKSPNGEFIDPKLARSPSNPVRSDRRLNPGKFMSTENFRQVPPSTSNLGDRNMLAITTNSTNGGRMSFEINDSLETKMGMHMSSNTNSTRVNSTPRDGDRSDPEENVMNHVNPQPTEQNLSRSPGDDQQSCVQLLKEQNVLVGDLEEQLRSVQVVLNDTEKTLENERKAHAALIQQMEGKMDMLRARITDTVSKTTDLPVQSPLRRPESEIIKEWQGLAYDVRNLVITYFKSMKDSKMEAWAKAEGDYLQQITPYYMDAASDKKWGSFLVQAGIWQVLWQLVFGDSSGCGGMQWAGKYSRKLSKLSSEISRDVAHMDSNQQQYAFHQWRALTTNLVSVISSPKSREQKIKDVVEEIEDFLEPFQSKLALTRFNRELHSIVRKAVALDEVFCGQQEWYYLDWPSTARHEVELDIKMMKPVGGGSKSRIVKYMVQPCLCRAGGGHNESYRQPFLLDQSHVLMY